MLETLKEAVCAANLELVKRGVVIYTWGECERYRPGERPYGHQTVRCAL